METNFNLDDFILRALAEDIGDGDHTTLSTIPADAAGKATLLVKENGILAGVEIAYRVLHLVDPSLLVEKKIADGHAIHLVDARIIP